MKRTERRIRRAVRLARSGKKRRARRLIERVMAAEPDNAHAWLVMAQVVDTDEAAIISLKEYLKRRPDDERVWARLRELQARASVPQGGVRRIGERPPAADDAEARPSRRLEHSPFGRFFILGGMGSIIAAACAALVLSALCLLPLFFGGLIEPPRGPDPVEVYRTEARRQIEMVATAVIALHERIGVLSDYPSIINDMGWRADLMLAVQEIHLAGDALAGLQSPTGMAVIHSQVLTSVRGCITSVDDLAADVEAGDAAAVRQDGDLLIDCYDSLMTARERLDAYIPATD
ncbi:MAG: hypothetical protein Kow00124_29140 [Anaerolineae bacterium]